MTNPTYVVAYSQYSILDIAAAINEQIGNGIGSSGFIADSVVSVSHTVRPSENGITAHKYFIQVLVVYAVHAMEAIAR